MDIVTLSDIEKEYTHLAANIELMRRDPSLLRTGGKYSSHSHLAVHACSTFICRIYSYSLGHRVQTDARGGVRLGDAHWESTRRRHDGSLPTVGISLLATFRYDRGRAVSR